MNKVKEKSQYDIQAEKFLKTTGTEFSFKFLKFDKYFPDDKEARDIYEITLKRGERSYTFKFGNSIVNSGYGVVYAPQGKVTAHTEKELNSLKARYKLSWKKNIEFTEPSAYDVLTCLQKYDPGTFENFCNDYGYDSDSRTAERTYKAVCEEWLNIQRLFTDEEITQLQEIN